MPKKKILTESEEEKVYVIRKGFNTSDGKRFNVGSHKPNFVFEKDFDAEDWKALVEMEAVEHAVEVNE